MAHLYSKRDKGKWVPDESRPRKKPPVRIPESNTASLTEENKFTLIGRATNPAAQNTKALVEFFLQHWNVTGTITGRALGPQIFQFKFDNERDLQFILNKSHSTSKDETINAIGAELGFVEDREACKAHARVKLNGLRQLEMRRHILLPSGEVKEVELEYEKLEKQCFLCKALSHEDSHCSWKSHHRAKASRPVDIAQTNTINRLEERKRRYNERQHAKGVRPSAHHRLQWSNSKEHNTELRWVPKTGITDPTPRGSLHSEHRSRDSSPAQRYHRYSGSQRMDHSISASRCSPLRDADRSNSNRLSARLSGSRRSYNRESPVGEVTFKSGQSPRNHLPQSSHHEEVEKDLSTPRAMPSNSPKGRLSAKGRLSLPSSGDPVHLVHQRLTLSGSN
ncbi:hypothetical protein Bca4012_058493 [Brassica carinata]